MDGGAAGDAAARRGLAWALATECRAVRAALLARGHAPAEADGLAQRVCFATLLGDAHGLDVEIDADLSGVVRLRDAWAEASLSGVDVFEHFLAAYDPALRRQRGVYATPPALVQAQVRLVADVLERRFGKPLAFGDPAVVTVDPAAGSGAYPLAVIAEAARRGGCSPSSLAARLQLWERLPVAALIARARLRAVLGRDVMLHVGDVLAAPTSAHGQIVVALGNPPYGRHPSTEHARGGWIRRAALRDFAGAAQQVGAGVHLKNLYNDYVYFWRWALWAVLEARPRPGIVSLVTAASYLHGPAFIGLRRLLRALFDELWIVDLEGDGLGSRQTPNVFGIRIPVCVAMGVRYGAPRPEQPAVVHHARLVGSRTQKLAQLERIQGLASLAWQDPNQEPSPLGWGAPLVQSRTSAYATWPRLSAVFPVQFSGCQMKRTWPIGPTPEVVRARWQALLALPPHERALAFRPSRDRTTASSPLALLDATERLPPLDQLRPGAPCSEPVRYAYRSFDRQWLLPDARLGDYMRADLWRLAGPHQVFLTSFLTGVLGSGPAAVATVLVPDLDHFRGSFGGRAVMPLWRDPAGTLPNLADGLLDRLAACYGRPVQPLDVLAYCYALLASVAYVERYREELRLPGPRLPLTADAALFEAARQMGADLLRWQTFQAVPHGRAWCASPPTALPQAIAFDPDAEVLQVGDGWFAGVSPQVWEFSISGLRVVPSWLSYRRQDPKRRPRSTLDSIRPAQWTADMSLELLEIMWALEATLAMQGRLAAGLAEIVAGPLLAGELP